MNKNLLFIDIEASGLPKNWDLPYTADSNWPHAMQVSWIVYDSNKNILKKVNQYIKNDGFKVQPGALKVHGLTTAYLEKNGKPRNEVLMELKNDIVQYDPLLIGHFVKLDYYVLSAGFFRSGMENPLHTAPVFCTMLATKTLAWSPMPKHLRLDELYVWLFNTELQGQHDALKDVEATAACFFELRDRGEITDENILTQTADFNKVRSPGGKPKGCILPAVLLLMLIILIVYIL